MVCNDHDGMYRQPVLFVIQKDYLLDFFGMLIHPPVTACLARICAMQKIYFQSKWFDQKQNRWYTDTDYYLKHDNYRPPPPYESERQPKLHDVADVPIVHTIYEVYKLWHQLILKFPKSERYSLGQEGGTILLKLLEYTLGASGQKDKAVKIKFLNEASIKLDLLKLLVRLAKDCHCLPNNKYLEFQSKLQSIGKMLGGWMKSIS